MIGKLGASGAEVDRRPTDTIAARFFGSLGTKSGGHVRARDSEEASNAKTAKALEQALLSAKIAIAKSDRRDVRLTCRRRGRLHQRSCCSRFEVLFKPGGTQTGAQGRRFVVDRSHSRSCQDTLERSPQSVWKTMTYANCACNCHHDFPDRRLCRA